MATASTAERVETRSRSMGRVVGIRRYSTGVPDADDAALPAPPVREVDLDWRSLVVVVVAFVALVALRGLVHAIPRTLTALAVAAILALALNPVVEAVERRLNVRKAVAVSTVVIGFAVSVVLLALVLVPPAVREARDLGSQLPKVVKDLGTLPIVGDDLERNHVPAKVQDWIEKLPDRLAGNTAPLERAGRSLADGLLAALVTLLLAITLLLDGDRLVGAVSRVVPDRNRERAHRAGRIAYEMVGRYVAGSLLVAAVAGLFVLTTGLILRVPLTPLAAAWVTLWDLVPQIGGAAGGIPFVLLAVTHGVGTGVTVAVLFVLYLQLENHVLQPLLVGHAVKLSPPATMTAALIGVSAAGVVGALVAVPVVGAAKAVYLEVRAGR
jgi:predicted PurR-regulated permease PerM